MTKKKFITQIKTKIPYTQKEIKIDITDKNLIIIGNNGEGKTTLLREIYKDLNFLTNRDNIGSSIEKTTQKIEENTKYLSRTDRLNISTTEYYQQKIMRLEETLQSFKDIGLMIDRSNLESLFGSIHNERQTGIIHFFEANRLFAVERPEGNLQGISSDSTKEFNTNAGRLLEKHIAYLMNKKFVTLGKLSQESNTESSLENSRSETIQKIDSWITEFTEQYNYLIDKSSVKLEYDENNLRIYIIEEGKDPYHFQDLSSGFESIFYILSALLLHVEKIEATPKDLEGIIIIDEIDAHLHISLQRKILPFFVSLFPNIQFIITTHSPFVISSIENTVVYDIHTQKSFEDLETYSLDTIINEILGVSTISKVFEKHFNDLVHELEKEDLNLQNIKTLVDKLRNVDFFSPRYETTIKRAELALEGI